MRTTLFCIILLFAAACAAAPAEPEPPAIAYGHDLCELCGMLIDDPRFAAALLFEDGQAAKFDDIADMFVYARQQPDRAVRAWFVHDYESETWLRAEGAAFVVSPTLHTPMGSGVAAFAQASDAQAFAGRLQGEVLTFDEVRSWASMHQHGHSH
jgi:copper chaperone NosL